MTNLRAGPTRLVAGAIATGLGSGLAPVAPATVASAIAVAVYWVLPFEGRSPWLFGTAAVVSVIGMWAAQVVHSDADPDPTRVVVDELAGMLVTVAFLDKSWPWMLAAFFAFRALDIVKPWPIGRFERLPGGLGIMADDLAAGVVAAGLLNAVRLAFFT